MLQVASLTHLVAQLGSSKGGKKYEFTDFVLFADPWGYRHDSGNKALDGDVATLMKAFGDRVVVQDPKSAPPPIRRNTRRVNKTSPG